MGAVVGSFLMATSTGNQVVSHSLGETPKFALFFHAFGADSGFADGGNITVGVVDSTPDDYSVSASGTDGGGAGSITTRSYTSDLAVVAAAATDTLIDQGDLSAWDATSFTINWTTVNGDARRWFYLLVGGANVEAKVLDILDPGSVTTQAYTGAGFQPQLVIFLYAQATASSQTNDGTLWMLGATDGTNQWAVDLEDDDAVGPSQSHRIHVTDACYVVLNSDGSIVGRAAISSLDADGFTLDFSDPVGATQHIAALCVGGLENVHVGTFQKSTSGAPVSQDITVSGSRPDALILASGQGTVETATAGMRFGIGASDGANEFSLTSQAEDGVSPPNTSRYGSQTKGFTVINNDTQTVDAEGDITLGNGEFSINWTTNNAVATDISYIAIESQRGGGGGSGGGGKGGGGGQGGGGGTGPPGGGGPPGQGGGGPPGQQRRTIIGSRRLKRRSMVQLF